MGRKIEVSWRIEGRTIVDEDELPKDHLNSNNQQVLDHAMMWIPELVSRFADKGEGTITDWEWAGQIAGASCLKVRP